MTYKQASDLAPAFQATPVRSATVEEFLGQLGFTPELVTRVTRVVIDPRTVQVELIAHDSSGRPYIENGAVAVETLVQRIDWPDQGPM